MRFLPSAKNRKVFGEIASEYDLVYFGHVDPAIDEDYKLVRGLTAAPHAVDENYTAGDVYDYAVVLLERSSIVKIPGNGKRKLHWTILQIDLKNAYLPHIFVDGSSREKELYGSLLASFLRLSAVNYRHFLDEANNDFAQKFTVYAQPDAVATIEQIFRPDITAMLSAHFTGFDFEIEADKLIVYANTDKPTLHTLDMMLRVGLFLARHLDAQTVTTPEEVATGHE